MQLNFDRHSKKTEEEFYTLVSGRVPYYKKDYCFECEMGGWHSLKDLLLNYDRYSNHEINEFFNKPAILKLRGLPRNNLQITYFHYKKYLSGSKIIKVLE